MSRIQSVVFEGPRWGLNDAEKWLKDHYLKTSFNGKQVHIVRGDDGKVKQLRYRQENPTLFKYYTTKKLSNDILLILGYN